MKLKNDEMSKWESRCLGYVNVVAEELAMEKKQKNKDTIMTIVSCDEP